MHAAHASPCRIRRKRHCWRRCASRLWFPGQRYDAASGLNYNYFRDYDIVVGRYVESDPVGLRGSIASYEYAGSAPGKNVDPAGLTHAVGFGSQRGAVTAAVAEAIQKIKNCKMPGCYPGLEEYHMSEGDKQAIINNLLTMKVVFNPRLVNALGFARQFQYEEVEIHPSAFAGGCLASVLAHEANHLGRNWGKAYRGTEERSQYIQLLCFKCGDLKGLR